MNGETPLVVLLDEIQATLRPATPPPPAATAPQATQPPETPTAYTLPPLELGAVELAANLARLDELDPMMRVYPSPDELQAALDRMGNPGTLDESLVMVAAQAGIAALRGQPVVWAGTEDER